MNQAAESRDAVVVPLTADRAPSEEPAAVADPDPRPAPKGQVPRGQAARTWTLAKWLAAGLAVAWLVGTPVGTMWAAKVERGAFFAFGLGLTMQTVLFAITSAAVTLGVGYALAAGIRLEDSAERLREAANAFAGGTGPNGHGARAEIDALNAEIDRALARLADAESLIRRQVAAINDAGTAIEAGATKSADRLETERVALISATEEVGREADAFAAKIEARTKAASEAGEAVGQRIDASEESLDRQIGRLEDVSQRSLERFESLATTMEGRAGALADQAEQQSEAAAKLGENQTALTRAQEELQAQSERLEGLIRDQRKRADRLAKTITDQTSRLTRLGRAEPQPVRRRGGWRDILAAVERSLPTADQPTEGDVKNAMDRLIDRMHRFSLTLKTQVYGGPAADDLARFEGGERLLFVRQLLEEEPTELKAQVAAEAARNAVFDQAVREFLGDFDALMEPVSGEGGGDEALAEYLRSPLGRLYVLIGTALGKFDR